MDNNVIRNKWTEEHISYLKKAYLQGSPLKQIASKLNRSVSAINKVLARHNLRTHSKMEHSSSSYQATSQQIIPKKSLENKNRSLQPNRLIFLKESNRLEVPFEHVLNWLKSQNISILKSKNDVYYEVDGIPRNQQQILYQANLLREQFQLPMFWVRGITHS